MSDNKTISHATFTIKADDLSALVKHVQPTAARVPLDTPTLRSVRFVASAGRLTAYSTDRYVIAAASYPVSESTLGEAETLEFYLTVETLKLAPKGKVGVVGVDVTEEGVRFNSVTVARLDAERWPVAALKILTEALSSETTPAPGIGLNTKYLASLAPEGLAELVFHGAGKAVGVFVDENRVGAIMPRTGGTCLLPDWVAPA